MRREPLPRRGSLAASLVLALLVATPARSDSYALLRAIVADEDGRPLKSTVVKISPPGLVATSDAQGFVQIRVKARTYEVSASRAGFEPDVLSGVELPAGGVKDVILILRPKAPSGTNGGVAAP